MKGFSPYRAPDVERSDPELAWDWHPKPSCVSNSHGQRTGLEAEFMRKPLCEECHTGKGLSYAPGELVLLTWRFLVETVGTVILS